MEPQTPIIIVLGLAALAFFAVGALRSLRRRRVLASTPVANLSELRPGFYRGVGLIRSSVETFASPLSNKRCVYYELLVEEKVRSGRERYWRTVVHDEKSSKVVIEDGIGAAEIDLPNAVLELRLDRHVSTGLLSAAPRVVEERLQERYGETTKGRFMNRKMRLQETFLEQGDEVHVIGRVAWTENGPSFGDGGDVFIVTDRPFGKIVFRETMVFAAWVTAGSLVMGLTLLLLFTIGPAQ